MIIGYAPGVYDLFHQGHLNVLRRASLMADVLIAGVTADDEVIRQKGRPAVFGESERMRIVGSVKFVSRAYLDRHATDKTLAWDDLRFDLVFKGGDWIDTEKGRALESAMQLRGAQVVYFPYTAGVSSSTLRQHSAISRIPRGGTKVLAQRNPPHLA